MAQPDFVEADKPAARVVGARPGHAPLIARFYQDLTAEARYERFFSHRPRFSAEELDRLSHPDPAHEFCAIALAGPAGREIMVGEARCVHIPDNHAGQAPHGEIAAVVTEAWRNRGIGRQLLCSLLAMARQARYASLFAYVGSTNAAMLNLIRQFEFHAQPLPGAGMRLLRRDLAPAMAIPEPACAHLALNHESTAEALAAAR